MAFWPLPLPLLSAPEDHLECLEDLNRSSRKMCSLNPHVRCLLAECCLLLQNLFCHMPLPIWTTVLHTKEVLPDLC